MHLPACPPWRDRVAADFRPMRLTLALFTFLSAVLCGTSGCAGGGARSHACALVLLVEGKHVLPTRSQFEAIERKLGAEFARRQLTLVFSPNGASHLATVELRPRPDAPDITDLIVRDVSANSFIAHRRNTGISSDMPSLRAVESEHQKAMSGFTVD